MILANSSVRGRRCGRDRGSDATGCVYGSYFALLAEDVQYTCNYDNHHVVKFDGDVFDNTKKWWIKSDLLGGGVSK